LIEELKNKETIEKTYQMISEYHAKYLKSFGVTLPKLYRSNNYSKDALVLIYLAYGYPDTKIVTKQELTEYIDIIAKMKLIQKQP
jgi:hypothetical protein